MPSTSCAGAAPATTWRSSADLDAASGADVVVVVNPDNPTGRLVRRRRRCARCDSALLVVDEAFIDLLPAEASLPCGLPANASCCDPSARPMGWPAAPGLRDRPVAACRRHRQRSWGRGRSPDRHLRSAAWRWTTSRGCRRRRQRLAGGWRATRTTCWCGRLRARGWNSPVPPGSPCSSARASSTSWPAPASMSVPSPASRRGCDFGLPAGEEAFARLAAALQVPQKVWQTRSSGGGGSA